METKPQIEDFYGVYLLCSQSEERKYRNRCYIGYTVNPNRRIKQHNRGRAFGGAKRTNKKGPWKMVMIIHGFPNNISALQFEWAWQSPKESSRLKQISGIDKKKYSETAFDYNFRILCEMLRIGPWNRLPLLIRWLAPEYVKEFPPDYVPPIHMQICHGHITIKRRSKATQEEISSTQNGSNRQRLMECHLCMESIENPQRSKIACINPKCKLTSHIVCLANECLESGQYVPIEGDCPICGTHFLWGDLIRKKNGCNDLEENENFDSDCEYVSEDSAANKSTESSDNDGSDTDSEIKD